MVRLDDILRSWKLSEDLHELSEGATPAEMAEFEKESGLTLPREWRELYAFTNGVSLFDGNVSLHPLRGGDFSIAEASKGFRQYRWPVPEELRLVGSNGQGEQLGIWIPASNGDSAPIVELAQGFDDATMAICSTSLVRFLAARTAYYLMALDGPEAALNALGVPRTLRTSDPDAATWIRTVMWSDPDRPATPTSPYDARLTVTDVHRLLTQRVH
jgi:hypothetical protein